MIAGDVILDKPSRTLDYLVLFHLTELIQQNKLKVIRFSPWWLSGTDAITAGFFSDLEAAIGRSVSQQALDALKKVTRRVLRFSKAASTAADMYAPGTGSAVGGVSQVVESLLPDDEDIATQHQRISELLEKADRRFLVIVDDIDRLAPDEAVQVFKLVKSIGQLPNVLYLLVFDRELAERVISEKYKNIPLKALTIWKRSSKLLLRSPQFRQRIYARRSWRRLMRPVLLRRAKTRLES